MAAVVDHDILHLSDAAGSVAFDERVLGFAGEGTDGPFSVVRVSESFTLQLAPWGTKGGEHLALTMTRAEFEVVLGRIRAEGIAHGSSFHGVGENAGPGEEGGARGDGPTLYFYDPDRHLLEIRHDER
jgi:hypothetical protein